MSMILCDGCGHMIDSDDDPECFVEAGNMRAQTKTVVWCAPCREREADVAEDRRAGPREFSQEQLDIIDANERDEEC